MGKTLQDSVVHFSEQVFNPSIETITLTLTLTRLVGDDVHDKL